MFKRGSIEDELMRSMEKELVSNKLESQHGFNKIARAVDHLNAAANLFDKAGMGDISDSIMEALNSVIKSLPEEKDEDQISGGEADDYEPKDFDQKTLEQGKEVEMEHTDDPELAEEIAMDHMVETTKNEGTPIESDYYKELAKLEQKLEK